MAIRAIDYCPPTDITFSDYLSALLTIDREVVPDDGEYHYRAALWKLFKNKSERKTSNRLLSLMSTMEGKHGDVHSHTEVPRETLVHELQRNSDLFTTQQLQGKQFFHDTVVTF